MLQKQLFFFHTNPYILNVTQQCWWSYFELRWPVLKQAPLIYNLHQEAIIDELKRLEDASSQPHCLDYLITELEICTAANKLKNNKSSYSERIKNEMN